ncbi:EXOC3 [Mytilus edulis]|uniref:EXOC3 n=1 Tax=Mytilus edulis TaxID=6550 RepID=A0A8S3PWC5_MYTED|nr:EXOC3 [Mytilus edulis]
MKLCFALGEEKVKVDSPRIPFWLKEQEKTVVSLTDEIGVLQNEVTRKQEQIDELLKDHTPIVSLVWHNCSKCKIEEGVLPSGKILQVVDTPGITSPKNQVVMNELMKSIEYFNPGPHAFLLVMQPSRSTKEDLKILKELKNVFGDASYLQNTIIIMVNRNIIRNQDYSLIDIHEYISTHAGKETMLPPIFPPDYNIVKTYVKMYHRALAGHLEEMIREGLEGNEFVTLLSWVNNYYSPDLMGHPDLNIDISELGPLLENNVIDELQNQYLRTMKFNIMEWMKNSLVQDKKIANINNSLSFGEYMKQLRNRYLKEDFEEDEENIRKDRFQKLNDTFLKIAKIGKLQFKTYDERKAAAEKLIKEGSQLGELFQKYGTSKVGVVKKYPDIRVEHLISLLVLRGDMNRADARQKPQNICSQRKQDTVIEKINKGKPPANLQGSLLDKLHDIYNSLWTCVFNTATFQKFIIEHKLTNMLSGSPILTASAFACLSYTKCSFSPVFPIHIALLRKIKDKELSAYMMSQVFNELLQLPDRYQFTESNKSVYEQYQISLNCFKAGIHFNVTATWLLLASLYYKYRRFHECIDIINYSLSKCTPDKILLHLDKTFKDQTYFQQMRKSVGFLSTCKHLVVENVWFRPPFTLLPVELTPLIESVRKLYRCVQKYGVNREILDTDFNPTRMTTPEVLPNGVILSCDHQLAYLHGFDSPDDLEGLDMTQLIPSFNIPMTASSLTKNISMLIPEISEILEDKGFRAPMEDLGEDESVHIKKKKCVIFQVKKVELDDGSSTYCMWVSRDPEDAPEYGKSFANLTLASTFNSTMDKSNCSLGEVSVLTTSFKILPPNKNYNFDRFW